jgi:hypothetical protein
LLGAVAGMLKSGLLDSAPQTKAILVDRAIACATAYGITLEGISCEPQS